MLRSWCCALLGMASVPAQTTWVVQGGGAALQQAIQAAAPGDVLDVMPATYDAVVVVRGLRIELRAGAVVAVPWPGSTSAITVSSLPAGEAFVLHGGVVAGVHATGCAGAVVCDRCFLDSNWLFTVSAIDGCTGPVVFQEVIAGTWPTFGSLAVAASAQVSFTSCRLPRTSVTGSNVSFRDVVIVPYGGSSSGLPPSLRVVSGSVYVAGGRIEGGVAASAAWHESGIELQQGELVLAGAAHVQESILWSLPTVPAIATLGGTLRIDPSVTIVGTPPIAGPAVVTFAPTPSTKVVRSAGSSSYRVDLAAEPASLAFTLIDLPQPVQSSPFGALWLQPISPILDVAVVPSSGMHSFVRSLAAVPPFLGLVVQSAVLSPAGAVAVGTPVRFVWD